MEWRVTGAACATGCPAAGRTVPGPIRVTQRVTRPRRDSGTPPRGDCTPTTLRRPGPPVSRCHTVTLPDTDRRPPGTVCHRTGPELYSR
eukprot:757170-Hanusia_phi.AAC.1